MRPQAYYAYLTERGHLIMYNRDKLYKPLYAKTPSSLWHVLFHGYNYIDPKTGEEMRGEIKDVDISIYGFLYLHSDMRNTKKGGTGLTDWFSAKSLSEASKPNPDSPKPKWSLGTVTRSLRRLRRAGYLADKYKPTAKRKAKLRDPAIFPSRKNQMEAEAKKWKEKLDEKDDD